MYKAINENQIYNTTDKNIPEIEPLSPSKKVKVVDTI